METPILHEVELQYRNFLSLTSMREPSIIIVHTKTRDKMLAEARELYGFNGATAIGMYRNIKIITSPEVKEGIIEIY